MFSWESRFNSEAYIVISDFATQLYRCKSYKFFNLVDFTEDWHLNVANGFAVYQEQAGNGTCHKDDTMQTYTGNCWIPNIEMVILIAHNGGYLRFKC